MHVDPNTAEQKTYRKMKAMLWQTILEGRNKCGHSGGTSNCTLKLCHYHPINTLIQIQHTKNPKIAEPCEASKTKK
jgi:hypothetical protein